MSWVDNYYGGTGGYGSAGAGFTGGGYTGYTGYGSYGTYAGSPGFDNYGWTAPYTNSVQTTPIDFSSPPITSGQFTSPYLGGGTESVTSYGSPSYQIQTSPMAATYWEGGGTAPITAGMFTPPSFGGTEEVVSFASPAEYQIQTTPFNFSSPALTPLMIGSPNFYSGTTEEVTAFAPPAPVQVHTSPFNYFSPALTQDMFPYAQLPGAQKFQQQAKAGQGDQKKSSGSSGGGASGGGGSQKPQPQPPQQKPVTPQQQQQLNALTPEQLAALLRNQNLTAQQRQAVQDTLNAKQRAAQQVAARGGSPAQQAQAAKDAKGPAAGASPLQPAAAAMPLILGAAVAGAWALTHRKQAQEAYTSVKRRVRRVMH